MSVPQRGLCECGCGGVTRPARQNDSKYGHVKGVPVRFIQGHVAKNRPVKEGFYRKKGFKLEHVLIAEAVLGRPLPPRAEVHHVDGNTLNNANNNLVICEGRAYHSMLHARLRVVQAGGDPNTQKVCNCCGRVLDLERFRSFPRNATWKRHAYCRECNNADRARRRAA